MYKLMKFLGAVGRPARQAIRIGADALVLFASLWLAFSVRLSEFYLWPDLRHLGLWLAAIALGLATFYVLGVYRSMARYFDGSAAIRLLGAMAGAAIVWMVLAHLSGLQVLPRSIGVIYWAYGFCLAYGVRYVAVQVLGAFDGDPAANPGKGGDRRTRIAIYGAGNTGYQLAQTLGSHGAYKVVAFFDDDSVLVGRRVAGVTVHSGDEAAALQAGLGIEAFYLAIPRAGRSRRLEIIKALERLPVEVRTVPSYHEIATGRFSVSDVRAIDIEDLLFRAPVKPRRDLLDAAVRGRTVLVTGAGGSIGSELCRQIAAFGVGRLVLLDHSEFALYTIHRELSQKHAAAIDHGAMAIEPVLGSILDAGFLDHLLRREQVDTVFHTAAYKHVPLVEDNLVIGVKNNVVGTRTIADVAAAIGIDRFIMISTDKAVRPTSIMGASKRMAELYLQSLADNPDIDTVFSIVRFGNVLASSGSVVPVFRQQIENGGPVTVTHVDVVRYFMSIPEASQLVLQAAAMASGGEVFVLDMGEPIRIDDLARMMITLSGLSVRDDEHPDGDIEVRYTGLRPGEKLYEELFVGQDLAETDHPRIMRARESRRSAAMMHASLAAAERAIGNNDAVGIRALLMSLVEAVESSEAGVAAK